MRPRTMTRDALLRATKDASPVASSGNIRLRYSLHDDDVTGNSSDVDVIGVVREAYSVDGMMLPTPPRPLLPPCSLVAATLAATPLRLRCATPPPVRFHRLE